jgi:hypothetical protein
MEDDDRAREALADGDWKRAIVYALLAIATEVRAHP